MDKMYNMEGCKEDYQEVLEIQENLAPLDKAVVQVSKNLEPLHDIPIHRVHGELSALEKAKIDLLGAYTLNSMFWVYLRTKGENPKEHGVKSELERIQTQMKRLKEIEDGPKAPKLDQDAAKRFVKNALWTQTQGKKRTAQTTLGEPTEEKHKGPPKKRRKKKHIRFD